MKKLIAIITIVMMCLAVQGYAQGRAGSNRSGRNGTHRSTQVEHRHGGSTSRPAGNGSYHSSTERQRGNDYQQQNHRSSQYQSSPRHQRNGNSAPRPGQGYRRHDPPRSQPPAPPRQHYAPAPRHHHHHCSFNDWYWYSWGGYHNRFICHRNYHNRFFDNLLGYYIWGSLNAPTRIDIGSMSFTRYNNMLQIQVGNYVSNLDLYQRQTVSYTINYTTVVITTGGGYAQIRFYDEYGNQASYQL